MKADRVGKIFIPQGVRRARAIAPGKFADVIVVDGDPLTNMPDMRWVTPVIKKGLFTSETQQSRQTGSAGAPFWTVSPERARLLNVCRDESVQGIGVFISV